MTRPRAYLDPMVVRGRISREQPLGLPLINLGFNELPYPPTPGVAEALGRASGQVQSYGSPHCDALRDKLGALHGIDADTIVCGNGSEEILDLFTRIFARPGDEVLISQYGYINFAICTNRVGATLVKAPEPDLQTDVDALLARVTDKTRLIFLANPNNPTGTAVSVEDLDRLASALPDHVVLIIDLAYGEFWGTEHCARVHRFVDRFDNVAVTRTFSKAYGLAGVRVGWSHTPDWMVPLLYAARGMGTVNALAQAAALAALSDQDIITERVAQLRQERDRVANALHDMGYEGPNSATNFLMMRRIGAPSEETEALVEHLFDAGGLIVNRTRETGLESYFRFSLGLPEHNDVLLAGVQNFRT